MEVDVPEGYVKFGTLGGIEQYGVGVGIASASVIQAQAQAQAGLDVVSEEPEQLVPPPTLQVPLRLSPVPSARHSHIEIDDTSELARASEAISISDPIVGRPHQQQLQHSMILATPIAESRIADAVNVAILAHAHGTRDGSEEDDEEEAMITSEVEAEENARRAARRRAQRHSTANANDDEEDEEEIDEDGHPIDPGARRRYHVVDDDDDRVDDDRDVEEEDEVNAHVDVGSV